MWSDQSTGPLIPLLADTICHADLGRLFGKGVLLGYCSIKGSRLMCDGHKGSFSSHWTVFQTQPLSAFDYPRNPVAKNKPWHRGAFLTCSFWSPTGVLKMCCNVLEDRETLAQSSAAYSCSTDRAYCESQYSGRSKTLEQS